MVRIQKQQIQSATTLPMSPVASQHKRVVQYSVAMGIRMVCIALLFVIPGWWVIIPALGAVILPYFAVVLANVGADSSPAALPVIPANNALVRRDETA